MRRRFWIEVALLIAVLIVTDRLLYAVLAAGFRRVEVGETGGMVNRLRQVKARVVVLGSSRAWRHYDAQMIADAFETTAYNGGCDGQGIAYARGAADLLLRDYAPDLFIIDVDPSQLVVGRTEYSRVTILAPFMDESPAIREMIYDLDRFERLKYLSRAFRFNGKPLAILKNIGAKDRTIAGFRPLDTSISDAPFDGAAMLKPLVPPTVEASDPKAIRLLRATLEAARTAGTRVVLCVSPRWESGVGPNPEQDACLRLFDRMAREAGGTFVAITPSNRPAFRDRALFADGAHLNRRGASAFTRALLARLKELGVAPAGRGGAGESAVPQSGPAGHTAVGPRGLPRGQG